MTQRLTSLSTFTGLGGLDLGLEAAGFSTLACVEWDDAARRSIKANRGDAWNLLPEGDISAVAASMVPADLGLEPGDLDLLSGAPPCQPYSKAGQWARGARSGLLDPRGQYLYDYLELLRRFQPKVAVIENVKGFVHGRTSALEQIRSRLNSFGSSFPAYRVQHRIIDAADHGVAQSRVRAIVVLTRLAGDLVWPLPSVQRTAWDALGREVFDEPEPELRGRWADLLPSIPEGENYLFHTSRGGGQELFGYRTRYWSFLLKLAKDRPSWTLPAQPGPATGPFHWENRPLRIQEMLRLQSFPKDWLVEGPARSEQVRQVGNATPPLLGEAIGRSLKQHITGTMPEGPLRLALEDRSPVPPPEALKPVPDRFGVLVGPRPEHPGPGLGPGAHHSAQPM